MEEKFDQIRLLLENKPYSRHVVQQYYAVENNLDSSQDEEVKFHMITHPNLRSLSIIISHNTQNTRDVRHMIT